MIESTAVKCRQVGVVGRNDHESDVQTHTEWYDTRSQLPPEHVSPAEHEQTAKEVDMATAAE